jgi:HSP20 family protein
MAEAAEKLPLKQEPKSQAPARVQDYFRNVRAEIERAFEDFDRGLWSLLPRRPMMEVEPFSRRGMTIGLAPTVDVVEKEDAFEITADLPGLEQKNIELNLSGDVLTIRGERQEEKEEKRRNYYLSERQFGLFQRSFQIPESVDPDKIDASFKNGVLTIVMPKKPEAKKAERQIAIK